MSIATWTEFQPLKEVLVGSAFQVSNFDHVKDPEARDLFKRVFEETNEDLETLCDILKQAGVKSTQTQTNIQFQ